MKKDNNSYCFIFIKSYKNKLFSKYCHYFLNYCIANFYLNLFKTFNFISYIIITYF